MWTCPKCKRVFKNKNQSHYCIKPTTIDEYILQQDPIYQEKLFQLRNLLKEALPEAEERISWSMPTYWKGTNIIHFACSKTHLGLYPGEEAVEHFQKELENYSTSKGTIRLSWKEDLPTKLIIKIAKWCSKHNPI